MNRLNNRLELVKRERYPQYRNGEVETLTFETEDYHLCYGEDSAGDIFDFCLIGNQFAFLEGKLTEAELVKAQTIIDNLQN